MLMNTGLFTPPALLTPVKCFSHMTTVAVTRISLRTNNIHIFLCPSFRTPLSPFHLSIPHLSASILCLTTAFSAGNRQLSEQKALKLHVPAPLEKACYPLREGTKIENHTHHWEQPPLD